jgi:hypothetical protein
MRAGGILMKRLLVAIACLACCLPCLAQNADEPASKDDIIMYLRTMHSHDLMVRTMEVQSKAMQKLFADQIIREKGTLPADFESRMAKIMDQLVKGMPVDEITDAMIPSYQNHFSKSDIEAMNKFYSSPVGQKVLEQLPAVMQEGLQAAMPIMSKYLSEWQERIKKEFEPSEKGSPSKTTPATPNQN